MLSRVLYLKVSLVSQIQLLSLGMFRLSMINYFDCIHSIVLHFWWSLKYADLDHLIGWNSKGALDLHSFDFPFHLLPFQGILGMVPTLSEVVTIGSFDSLSWCFLVESNEPCDRNASMSFSQRCQLSVNCLELSDKA